MKTITIKLPENESMDLDAFIKEKNYPSKSEFIRHLIINSLDKNKKEKIGWSVIAEKSLKKIWNNKKDDKLWENYL